MVDNKACIVNSMIENGNLTNRNDVLANMQDSVEGMAQFYITVNIRQII